MGAYTEAENSGTTAEIQNIVLFLSSITRNSRALREEIEYGIGKEQLPVIVVYPEFRKKAEIRTSDGRIRKPVCDLWSKLPTFRDLMGSVPTAHVPMKKNLIESVLKDKRFAVQTAGNPKRYSFPYS